MNWQSRSDNYFFYSIPICIVVSILLASVFFWSIKKEFQNQLKGVEVVLLSNTDFDATLYYTNSKVFDEQHTIGNTGNHKDTLLFLLPKTSEMIKRFRLDFGNNLKLKEVKIKSFSLILNDRKIEFDEKEIFDSRFLASPSVFFNRNDHVIEIKNSVKPFDPYIVFPPLGELAMTGFLYPLSILTPFLGLVFLYLIKFRKEYKIGIVSLLTLFFIICIPLKIAWTTFSTLLLGAYGIGLALHSRKLLFPNSIFYFFMIVFLILILLGRPVTYSAMDELLSLPLFAVLGITISFPKLKVYRYFVFVFLIFNAVVISSGIHFLIWFNDFYGLHISDYFVDIKTYSEIVKGWLYYEHATFLSFFGLVGMLFAHGLFRGGKLEKKILCLYDALLIIFIVLVGTRICLLIYVVFLLNMLVEWNIKKRLLINVLIFAAVAVNLVYNIEKIDQSRHYLWAVSWNAIKEKPWFGYGLGKSDEILHNDQFLPEVGFSKGLDFNHSHNQFITYLLEIGIVGLATLAGFLAYYLYKTRLYRNTELIMFFFGLGYIFLTESILETSKPLYVICFIFLAIAVKGGTEKNNKSEF